MLDYLPYIFPNELTLVIEVICSLVFLVVGLMIKNRLLSIFGMGGLLTCISFILSFGFALRYMDASSSSIPWWVTVFEIGIGAGLLTMFGIVMVGLQTIVTRLFK